ncbi:hypothetical protein V6N13_059578 [Hibiscus sabdariffa]
MIKPHIGVFETSNIFMVGPFTPDFLRPVRDNWNSQLSIADTIKQFSKVVAKWNVEVFGSIQRDKSILMARLWGVQCCLDQHRTSNMLELEAKLLNELEIILAHEELHWKHED